jgi:hypothetical protein
MRPESCAAVGQLRYRASNAVSAARHLLANPVAGAGDDHALHVVRGEVHRVPDLLSPACRSADGQDGHRLAWATYHSVATNAGGVKWYLRVDFECTPQAEIKLIQRYRKRGA